MQLRPRLSESSLFGTAVAVFLTIAGGANAASLNVNLGAEVQNGSGIASPTHLLLSNEKPVFTSAFEPVNTPKNDKNKKQKTKKSVDAKQAKPLLVAAGMPMSSGGLSYTKKTPKIEQANIKTIIRRDEEEKIITSWLNEDKLRKQVSYNVNASPTLKTKTVWKSSAKVSVNDDFSPDLIKNAEPASVIDKTEPEALSASISVQPRPEELKTVYSPADKVSTMTTAASSSREAPVYQELQASPWQTAEVNLPPANQPLTRNQRLANVEPVPEPQAEFAELKPLASAQTYQRETVSAQEFARTFAPMYADGASYEEAWENRQEAALWSVPKNHQETNRVEANQVVVEKPVKQARASVTENWVNVGANVIARPLPVAATAKAADPKVEEFLGTAPESNASPSWLPTDTSASKLPEVVNVDEKSNQETRKNLLMPLANNADSSLDVQETAEAVPFFADDSSVNSASQGQAPENRSIIERVKGFFSSDNQTSGTSSEPAYNGSLSALFSEQAAEAQAQTPALKRYSKQRQETASMPSEIKLTFPKGSADVSAATVKWLKAFSAKAAKDSRMIVEIKMSNIGLDMQARRFAIIRNILTSNGVPTDRINPVLTSRNPDTVILKTSAVPQEDGNIPVIDAMGGSYLDASSQK